MLRETVAASAALALLIVLVAGILGHFSTGFGLGAGLVVGSFNGHFVARTLEGGAPFVGTSLLRMAAISAIAILAAVLLGVAAWTVLIGVGVAQFVLVAAGIRQGLRA
jgi:hypothetical protein